MQSLVPLTYRIRRLLAGQRVGYQDLSHGRWEISPAVDRPVPSALYLPGELDKVTSVSEFTTWDIEKDRVLSTRRRQQATWAYQLHDVQIIDGFMYKGPMKEVLVPGPEKLWPQAPETEIAGGALACTYSGNRFFGHCLRHDFPLALLAQELGQAMAVNRPAFGHEPGYRDLCSIFVPTVDRVRCRELVVVDDIGYTASKRDRLGTIRARLLRHAPADPPAGVMLRRGGTGVSRVLVNEDEIEALIQKRGFVVLNPTRMTVQEIVRSMGGTPLVLGVEGSQMNHGLLNLADHGTVLTLQPPYRFNNVLKEYTDCLGMGYAFVVGQAQGDGFYIHPDVVQQTLDLIQNGRKPG